MADRRKQSRNAVLDYLFSWRWLLPLQKTNTVCLLGFDQEEFAFWQTLPSPSSSTDLPEGADALIVNGNTVEVPPTGSAVMREREWICVIGKGTAVKRWATALATSGYLSLRQYCLLPSGRPRVVVPLDSARHAVQGLALHQPGRRFLHLAVKMVRVLARAGISAPLRRRVLLIARRNSNPISASGDEFSRHSSAPVLDYALYLGSPEDNRKTVVLLLGPGLPDTILKTGASPCARRALLREYQTLCLLQDTPLCSNVPLPKGIYGDDDCVRLYLEYRERLPGKPSKIESKVVEFLSRLSAIERRHLASEEWLVPLLDTLQAPEPIKGWLQQLGGKGLTICRHRGHGDFAPWNVACSHQGIFVYDWEDSRPDMLAFEDAFYYVVAQAVYLQRNPDPARTAGRAIALARAVAASAGLGHCDVALHFSLWCLGRLDDKPLYARMLSTLDLDSL